MNDLNNLDIRTLMIDAIVDVFDTMVSMEIAFFDSEPPDTTGTERMVATVNLAGNVVGLITIQVPSEMSGLMMAGKLDIDGLDIRTFDLQDYRRQLGIVSQTPFLFAGTIAENIAYGRPDAGADEIRAVARLAGPNPAAFAGLAKELTARGYSAPRVLDADLDAGLAVEPGCVDLDVTELGGNGGLDHLKHHAVVHRIQLIIDLLWIVEGEPLDARSGFELDERCAGGIVPSRVDIQQAALHLGAVGYVKDPAQLDPGRDHQGAAQTVGAPRNKDRSPARGIGIGQGRQEGGGVIR